MTSFTEADAAELDGLLTVTLDAADRNGASRDAALTAAVVLYGLARVRRAILATAPISAHQAASMWEDRARAVDILDAALAPRPATPSEVTE